MSHQPLKIIFIFLLLIVGQSLSAQDIDQMLMFQIEGNKYIKKNYDKNGNLEKSQIFKVGTVKKEKEIYTMPVKVYGYDKNGKLLEGSNTNYTCKPTDQLILMNIFPFADLSANKTVKIESKTSFKFYPTQWKVGNELDEIEFSISIKGGALGAFGTTSEIKIYNRKVTGFDNNNYTITSTMVIKAYVFGILLKTIKFNIEEEINLQKGIVKQNINESTGEKYTITLQ